MDHGDIDHALAVFGTSLVVARQTIGATKPGERALHYPTPRRHYEAF